MASSEVKVKSIMRNRTRCGLSGSDTINVEKRSLKSLVNGRSSSVMRRRREEVWCILRFGLAGSESEDASSESGVRLRLGGADCRGVVE
jgi:hypothetical protein